MNLSSQAGGIHNMFLNRNSTIPNGSKIYPNTVHAQNFVADRGIDYEISSHKIANDVIALLNSPTTKFSSSIGNDAHCNSNSIAHGSS